MTACQVSKSIGHSLVYVGDIMTVSDLLKQTCNRSDNINKVVTSC